MAVKTITVDMEAYDLLAKQKRDGQSFSEVIKERLAPPKTARGLLEALKGMRLSESTLRNVEEQIRDRKKHPARAARL